MRRLDLTHLALSGIILVAGCNMITGADDLVSGERSMFDEADEDDGGGESSGQGPSSGPGSGSGTGSGSGAVGSGGSVTTSGAGGGATSSGVGVGVGGATTSTSATGSGGSGGGTPPPPPPPPVGDAADGVTITDVQLYQAINVSLMGNSDIPVVANRDAMVRIFYEVDGAYNGQPVTGRFSAGQYYAEATQALSSSPSSQSSLSSTLNIDVPGYMLPAGVSYRVDMVQSQGSGTNSAAGYPPGTQQIDLGAKSTGDKLRVVLVPVQNNGLPDTSPEQVQKYADWLGWQYPIPEVEVTVRSQPYTFNGSLGSYNGWSNLLDEITDLRYSDNADDDVYYYGIHVGSNGGLLGLGWIGDANDVWSRNAIGVGWTGDTAPETAVHELGHNHGRQHSPCGVSGDANYPHSGASIGVWGYHPAKKQLLDPYDYVDFMSYCDPAWVSDYTYKALFTRLKNINGAKIFVPPHMLDRTYDRVRILDGQLDWLTSRTMPRPPMGQEKAVTVTTLGGTKVITGNFFPYNHLDGGVMFILRPKLFTVVDQLQAVAFDYNGQLVSLGP